MEHINENLIDVQITENAIVDGGLIVETLAVEAEDPAGPAETTNRLNDALIIGGLNAPEARAVRESPVIVGYSERAPKVAAEKWWRIESTWQTAQKISTSFKGGALTVPSRRCAAQTPAG